MGPCTSRPRVGISRCLLGDEVRYDGGHKRDAVLLDTLGTYVEWVPVCPEVEMGMDTPREPIHLVSAADGVTSGSHRVRLVGVMSGRDWTAAMETWRRGRVRELAKARLSGYVLKQDSPSCGLDGVRVDAGGLAEASAPRNGALTHTGRGLFAQALLDAMPDLPIAEEGRLHEGRARECFLERVLSHHRELCLRKDL